MLIFINISIDITYITSEISWCSAKTRGLTRLFKLVFEDLGAFWSYWWGPLRMALVLNGTVGTLWHVE